MTARMDADEVEALLQIIGALTAARCGDDDTWAKFITEAPDPRFLLSGLCGLTLSLMDTLEQKFGVPMDEYLRLVAAAAAGVGPAR